MNVCNRFNNFIFVEKHILPIQKVLFWWKISLVVVSLSWNNFWVTSCKLCEIDSILECEENISQLTWLLRADNRASILEILEQSGFVELLSLCSTNDVQIFGCICGAMPNKDVSIFLSMLRSSLVWQETSLTKRQALQCILEVCNQLFLKLS